VETRVLSGHGVAEADASIIKRECITADAYLTRMMVAAAE